VCCSGRYSTDLIKADLERPDSPSSASLSLQEYSEEEKQSVGKQKREWEVKKRKRTGIEEKEQ
jgi:hypothetical protein